MSLAGFSRCAVDGRMELSESSVFRRPLRVSGARTVGGRRMRKEMSIMSPEILPEKELSAKTTLTPSALRDRTRA
jgi:hypothetical protein